MKRRIIKIDEKLCNGCGACASACHEGAIRMIDGVAHLVREDFCDGLGDCLPACPTGAISFEEREAPAYDEAAVIASKNSEVSTSGCPGSAARELHRNGDSRPRGCPGKMAKCIEHGSGSCREAQSVPSRLRQWPCQIKLVSSNATYLDGADLLIAADCTAYAYGNFHNDFIKNRITLIGCPKLDAVDYTDKLTEILKSNDVRSLTVVRMEVPCCGGIESAAREALRRSGRFIPWQVITVSTDGKIIN